VVPAGRTRHGVGDPVRHASHLGSDGQKCRDGTRRNYESAG
jgi:hypothetical protein